MGQNGTFWGIVGHSVAYLRQNATRGMKTRVRNMPFSLKNAVLAAQYSEKCPTNPGGVMGHSEAHRPLNPRFPLKNAGRISRRIFRSANRIKRDSWKALEGNRLFSAPDRL